LFYHTSSLVEFKDFPNKIQGFSKTEALFKDFPTLNLIPKSPRLSVTFKDLWIN